MNMISSTGKLILFTVFSTLFLVPCIVFAQAAPSVQTFGPKEIYSNRAVISGWVNANQTSDTDYWFEWGIGGQTAIYETTRNRAGSSPQEVSATLSGLAPETGYFYRLVAENSRGREVGYTTQLITKALPKNTEPAAIAITFDANKITETSANLKGYVASNGSNSTVRWFEWGVTSALGNATNHNGIGGADYINENIANLSPDTTYYFRAVAENSQGKNAGIVRMFHTIKSPNTTNPGQTSVGTGNGTNNPLNNTSPTLSGEFTEVVVTNITDWSAEISMTSKLISPDAALARIEYGTKENDLSEWISWDFIHQGSNTITHTIAPLTTGKKYYYRATMKDDHGYIHSQTRSFTTLGGARAESGGGTAQNNASANTNTGTVGTQAENSQTSKNTKSPNEGSVFSGADTTKTTNGASDGTSNTKNPSQVLFASVGGVSDSFTGFWKGVFGIKPITLHAGTSAENKSHSTVEYVLRYANDSEQDIHKAVLRVIFPKNVIYIGDDTSNEFQVEDNPGSPERVYVLPIGTLSKHSSRIITMLGMQTSDTDSDTTVRAKLDYLDAQSSTQTIASTKADPRDIRMMANTTQKNVAVSKKTTNTGGSFWSLFWWVLYIGVVFAMVLIYRKLRKYYDERQKQIEAEKLQLQTLRA